MDSASRAKIFTELVNLREDEVVFDGIAVLAPGAPYVPIGVVIDEKNKHHAEGGEGYIIDGEVVFDVGTHTISTGGTYFNSYTEFELKEILMPAMAHNNRQQPHAIVAVANNAPLFLAIKNVEKNKWTASGFMKSKMQYEFLAKYTLVCNKYGADVDPNVYPDLFEKYVGCNFAAFMDLERYTKRTQSAATEKKVISRFSPNAASCPTPAVMDRKRKFHLTIRDETNHLHVAKVPHGAPPDDTEESDASASHEAFDSDALSDSSDELLQSDEDGL